MLKINKKDIVLIPFPFSDMSISKIRPAIVLGLDKEDVTCVFITTHNPKSNFIPIKNTSKTNIKQDSYIRYTKIASLSSKLCLAKIGALTDTEYKNLVSKINEFMR